jgi:hypothetical protein
MKHKGEQIFIGVAQVCHLPLADPSRTTVLGLIGAVFSPEGAINLDAGVVIALPLPWL